MGAKEGRRHKVTCLREAMAIVSATILALSLLVIALPASALADVAGSPGEGSGDPGEGASLGAPGADVTINAPCGDALTWSFDSASGTLVIEGAGPMYDWGNSDQVPWYGVRDQVTSVVIGEGVTTVGANALFGMRYLASVTLPSTLASIGDNAFANALDLGAIELPAGLASIGEGAFHMSGLVSIALPDSVTYLGEMAFMSCANLAEVRLSSGLSEVPSWAFYGCGKLASAEIPEGVGRIGSLAFFDCPNLQRIYIPSTVGWIESQAFSDDVSFTVTIYYGGTSEAWVCAFSAEENPVLMACAIEFQATGLGTDVSSVAAPQGVAAYAYRTDTLPAFYPDSAADANTLTALYDLGGVYVTNVSDVVAGDLDEALGSYTTLTFSFDVYNTLPYDVVIDVFDAYGSGSWTQGLRVEGHASAQPGVTPESLGVSYTDPSVSTLTRVTLTMPSPGYLLISANPAQSVGTFAENAALALAAGTAQAYGGANDPAAWEAAADALASGVLDAVFNDPANEGADSLGAERLAGAYAQTAFDASAAYAVGNTGAAAELLASAFAEMLDELASNEMAGSAAVDWRSQLADALGIDAATLAGLDPKTGLGIATAPAFGEGGELAATIARLCEATDAPVAVIGSSARTSSTTMQGVSVSYGAGEWDSELPTVVLNVDGGVAAPVVADASGAQLSFGVAQAYDVFCLTVDQQRCDLAGPAQVTLPTPVGSDVTDCIVLRQAPAAADGSQPTWEVLDATPEYGDFGDLAFSASEAGVYAIVDVTTAYDSVTGEPASASGIELPERYLEVYASAASLTMEPGGTLDLACMLCGPDGQALARDAPVVEVADPAVASAGTPILDEHGSQAYLFSLTGIAEGVTDVTVTDAASGASVTFAVTVGNAHGATYELDDVPAFYPDVFGEDELLTNFYDVNGLYVNNYVAVPAADGSWTVSFDVYNRRYYCGSVDVYDADGTWVASRRLEQYHDIASLWDTGESAYYLISDLVSGTALSYQADAGSQLTEVRDLTVPAGGYLTISNAAAASPGTFLYNAVEFLMAGAESIVDAALGDVDYGIVADAVVSDVLSNQVLRDAFLDQFAGFAYEMGQTALAAGVGDAVEAMTLDVEDLFGEYGLDWKGIAQAALGIGENVFSAITGPVGATLKGVFALSDMTNAMVQTAQLCDGLNAPVITLLAPGADGAQTTIRGDSVTPTYVNLRPAVSTEGLGF